MNTIVLGIEVIWDAQVKSFEEIDNKVHVHFVDSTKHQTEVVDLLIGADGVHSPIRKQLTGDVVRSAGFNAVVGLIRKEADGNNDDLFEHELINNSGVLVSGRNGNTFSGKKDIKKKTSFLIQFVVGMHIMFFMMKSIGH